MKKIIIILLLLFSFNMTINAAGYCAFKISGGTDYFVDEYTKEIDEVNSDHECYLLFSWRSDFTDSSHLYRYNYINNEECNEKIFEPIQLYCKNINYYNYYDYSDSRDGEDRLEYDDVYGEISTKNDEAIYLKYISKSYNASFNDITGIIEDLNYAAYLNQNQCGNISLNLAYDYDDTIEVNLNIDGSSGIYGEYFSSKQDFFSNKGINDCSPNDEENGSSSNNTNNSGNNSNNNTPPGANAGSPNDKYSGIESCTEIDVKRIKACGCIPAEIADITSKVYFILRIVGPILLLILGGFDMAKAIASQDESSIEKAKKKLVNKFIAAAAIFLILTVIEFIVSLLAKNAIGIMDCINILLDGYKI